MTSKVVAAAVALALSASVSADISYVQKIDVEGSGGMSMFSSSGEVLTQISGDRSRSESDVKMKSKLAGMFNQRVATVVRLDRELSLTLYPEDRKYSEQSFAEVRTQLAKMEESAESMQGSGQGLPVSEDSCSWSRPDLDVDSSRKKEKIAGIKTKKHTITLQQSCKDPDSGSVCEMTWMLESWLAKKVPAQEEVLDFQRRYAAALGMDALMHQTSGSGQALLAMFDGNWEDVAHELSKLKGYPLKSIMQMDIGGELCVTASGSAIAMDEVWTSAGDAAYDAAIDQAGRETGSAVGSEVGRTLGGSIGGNIGGAAIGAAAGELVSGLGSMFKKKKKPEVVESAAAAQITAFRITSEVTRWSEISIPAERFEAPSGWSKK